MVAISTLWVLGLFLFFKENLLQLYVVVSNVLFVATLINGKTHVAQFSLSISDKQITPSCDVFEHEWWVRSPDAACWYKEMYDSSMEIHSPRSFFHVSNTFFIFAE